jgi:hypothetical protein
VISFPVKNVFIEGPDCSGKTTLIRDIHKESGYRWHLMDRSQISRMIFARMNGRNIPFIEDHFKSELYNLNNLFVFLLPPWNEISRRFGIRGDEIHDIKSLRCVYENFQATTGRLIHYPNVMCFQDISKDKNTQQLKNKIISYEKTKISEISNKVIGFAAECPRNEATDLSFTIYDDGMFDEADAKILDQKDELEYYRSILSGFLTKIENEKKGINEYHLPQENSSRRFVYVNESCISFIQAVVRDGVLDMHFVLRSTDVINKMKHDLNFLYYLTSETYKKLDLSQNYKAKMRFYLNSAHMLQNEKPIC